MISEILESSDSLRSQLDFFYSEHIFIYGELGESSGGATALTAARQPGTATTWRARSISSEVSHSIN